MRIFVLSQQLEIEPSVIVDVLKDLGIKGKGSALASLTDEETDLVKKRLPEVISDRLPELKRQYREAERIRQQQKKEEERKREEERKYREQEHKLKEQERERKEERNRFGDGGVSSGVEKITLRGKRSRSNPWV